MLEKYQAPFFYATPALAIALLGLPLYVYLPTFYAQDVGLGMFEVGLILFVARFLDVLFDPIIGYISDKFALRKSLMLLGALLLLLGFYFLTHPLESSGYFWLFSFSVVVYFAWSMITVPYYALGADISQSYHENTAYASAREFFNITGVLLALILPYAFDVAQNAKSSLELMFQSIVYILPLSMLLFTIMVKHKKLQASLYSLRENLYALFTQVKQSKELFLAFFLNNFANAIPATLFLLYVEQVIGETTYTGALLLLYFVSGILALPFWIAISKKFNKKTAWRLSMLSASLFFAFVPFLGLGDLYFFTAITILSGLSLGADMALPASMQADIAKNSSGSIFGFFAMLTKLSLAFGVGLSFGVLGLVEFDASNPSEYSLVTLSLLYGLVPVLLKILAILTLNKFQEQ
jgi:glycoside/pentoside/hexuronide:cation symporter, GPH family